MTYYTRRDAMEAQNLLHNIKTLPGVRLFLAFLVDVGECVDFNHFVEIIFAKFTNKVTFLGRINFYNLLFYLSIMCLSDSL